MKNPITGKLYDHDIYRTKEFHLTWEVTEARKAAVIVRKHGLKCRVVRCKHYSSYLRIYLPFKFNHLGRWCSTAFVSAREEWKNQNIDASYDITYTKKEAA